MQGITLPAEKSPGCDRAKSCYNSKVWEKRADQSLFRDNAATRRDASQALKRAGTI